MDLGLYIAASGMVAEQVRQDQLSNDLANASTPGYKPDESSQHSFGDVLLANSEGGPAIGSVDAGVALGKTYTDMTPGSMQETGEPLDFAIEGSGFFAVKTAQGVRYTRDGQFTSLRAGGADRRERRPRARPERSADQSRRRAAPSPPSALGVFEVPGAVKQGENLYTGSRRRQAERHGAPGLARGLGRGRRQDDGRNDHLAAQLPVRPAGDPGDRPDPAGGRLAGRLAERPADARSSPSAAADHRVRSTEPGWTAMRKPGSRPPRTQDG